MKLKEIPTNAEEIDFDENNNEEEELSTAEKAVNSDDQDGVQKKIVI